MALSAPTALAAEGGNAPGDETSAQNILAADVVVSGKVKNSLTGAAIKQAGITFIGSTGQYSATTDNKGLYNISLPQDVYAVTATATDFNTKTLPNVSVQHQTNVVNVPLAPVANVVVHASISPSNPQPGDIVTLTGSRRVLDGSTVISGKWTQTTGVPSTIKSGQATLAGAADYKAALFTALTSPPLTPAQVAQLPEWQQELYLDESDFQNNGLQNRWQVVGINDFNLGEANGAAFRYTVTTSSGTYTADAPLTVSLPWAVSTGLRTVPIGVGVLLDGKCATFDPNGDCTQTYAWEITSAPVGSGYAGPTPTKVLADANTQAPYFTPDKVGEYEVKETLTSTVMNIYAGLWQGVIDPLQTLNSVLYGDGMPVADNSCATGCHRPGQVGPDGADMDAFTPWRQSGHAEIFTQNMTPPGNSPNGHYGSNCFACHTVGFDTNAQAINNGFDDQPGYLPFLNSGLINSGLDGWLYMLEGKNAKGKNRPSLVGLTRLANIQCENCHGPQQYTPHAYENENPEYPDVSNRVSISSDVCATCHGEPPRHGRFQEWVISGHADYNVARGEGTRTTCTRCHSGQGFIMWTKKYANDPENNLTVPCTTIPSSPNYKAGSCDISWNTDTVHPQTCATCHEPHMPGTTAGAENDATVRISGNTPLLAAGFTAYGVGTGAVCMTCHNSRRATAGSPLRDDAHWVQLKKYSGNTNVPGGITYSTAVTQGPHDGPQADMLEGQNAFFVTIPGAGGHATLDNTCNKCHMELSKAPLPISPEAVNSTGTNHTFLADPDVCSNCHGSSFIPQTGMTGGDAPSPNFMVDGALMPVTSKNVQTQISGLLTQLVTAMGNGYQRLMGKALPITLPPNNANPSSNPQGCGSVQITNAGQIQSVTWNSSTSLTIVYNTGTVSGTCVGASPGYLPGTSTSTNKITVTPNVANTDAGATNLYLLSLTGSTTGPTGGASAYNGPGNDGALLKASWNRGQVNNDASLGVHNHAFEANALQNAIMAVNNVAP